MEIFSAPYSYVHSARITVGGVGPVGDPNMNIRYRRSSSEMTPIFERRLSRGSNITDGNNPQMYRVSAGAKVKSMETHPRVKKMSHKTRITDKIPSGERVFEAKTCGDPHGAWKAKKSSIFYKPGAYKLPNGFEPKPGILQRGVLPVRTEIDPKIV